MAVGTADAQREQHDIPQVRVTAQEQAHGSKQITRSIESINEMFGIMISFIPTLIAVKTVIGYGAPKKAAARRSGNVTVVE